MTLAVLAALVVQLEAATLGDVLCAESRGMLERPAGRLVAGRVEVLALAETARKRARDGRRSILREVSTAQWAHGCPAGERRPFVKLAGRFLAGKVHGPKWARRAVGFVAPRALGKVNKVWRARGLVPIRGTRTVHVFWRRR